MNKKFYSNKKIIIISAFILILFMVVLYIIMTSGTHFESKDQKNAEISFNYPSGWVIQERTSGTLIQGEKNSTDSTNKHSVLTVSKIPTSQNSLDQVKSSNIYLKTGNVVNQTNRTVDGVSTTVLDIDEMGGPDRGKIGEVKLVFFTKDNYIYSISFVTGDSIKNIQNDIDMILNSFHTSGN